MEISKAARPMMVRGELARVEIGAARVDVWSVIGPHRRVIPFGTWLGGTIKSQGVFITMEEESGVERRLQSGRALGSFWWHH